MPEQRPQSPGKHGRRRKWKRTVILALLLLAGGAIVNVAVAWGLAAYAPVLTGESIWDGLRFGEWSTPNLDWWKSQYPFDVPALPVQPPSLDSIGEEYEHARVTYARRDKMDVMLVRGLDVLFASGTCADGGYATVRRVRTGVPMKSMMWAHWRLEIPLPHRRSEEFVGPGIPLKVSRTNESWAELTFLLGERRLPLQPLWFGFIINTLFHALLLWLLFFAPFAARRMLRRRRGQCEKCAYPIGVSAVCTECGAAVSRNEPRARQNGPRA